MLFYFWLAATPGIVWAKFAISPNPLRSKPFNISLASFNAGAIVCMADGIESTLQSNNERTLNDFEIQGCSPDDPRVRLLADLTEQFEREDARIVAIAKTDRIGVGPHRLKRDDL